MEHTHNSLAEIKRCCIALDESPDKGTLLRNHRLPAMEKVPHPSNDFEIQSDGTYYLVTNNGLSTLYKIRS